MFGINYIDVGRGKSGVIGRHGRIVLLGPAIGDGEFSVRDQVFRETGEIDVPVLPVPVFHEGDADGVVRYSPERRLGPGVAVADHNRVRPGQAVVGAFPDADVLGPAVRPLFRRDEDFRTSAARAQEVERWGFLVFDRGTDENAAGIPGHLLGVPGGVIEPIRKRLVRGFGRGVDIHSLFGGKKESEKPPGVFEIPGSPELSQSQYGAVDRSVRSLNRFSVGIRGSFLVLNRDLDKSEPG